MATTDLRATMLPLPGLEGADWLEAGLGRARPGAGWQRVGVLSDGSQLEVARSEDGRYAVRLSAFRAPHVTVAAVELDWLRQLHAAGPRSWQVTARRESRLAVSVTYLEVGEAPGAAAPATDGPGPRSAES